MLSASEGRRWRAAVDNLPDCLCSSQGELARERRRGHRRHFPKRPEESANILRWARRGPLPWSIGACIKQRPTEQHSNGKIQDIQGWTGELRCYPILAHIPFKKSHQNLLTYWREKLVDGSIGKV